MKKLINTAIFLIWLSLIHGQSNQEIINKLPDFIPPSPEAASLIKADNLNVGFSTGSPNINIPLFNFQAGSYSLPITLNYSSTGVKVDDYASMIGMGWSCNFGGVISRTVMDKPDESRSATNCNLNSINATVLNQSLYDFLTYAPDKESDIFTFSFPGYSGKFIIGLTNNTPIQLTKNNLRMVAISNDFTNGFIITTDNGTAYYFEDTEVSTSRNPTGTNCEKTYDNADVITSWYLTKIVLPNTRRQIFFTYTTSNIDFQNSITHTISRVTYSDQKPCGGFVCTVGTERYSECISQQTVATKFISKIQSSEGDKVEFLYDGTGRTDLNGGKRLSDIKVTNRNGRILSRITFGGSYQSATSGSSYNSKRLFLESVSIRGTDSLSSPLTYSFSYINYSSLPERLKYCQDFYGYYNGKTSNPSLLPVLPSTDINYSTFENGAGAATVDFGDRSIDTTYSNKGLLNKITYPTGGYDSILYIANKVLKSGNEVLAGGHSVSKIKSYTYTGNLVLEKEFIYRNKDDNALSSFLLTENLSYSKLNVTKKDGDDICGTTACEGLSCNYAVVTSNANHPLTTFGSQHLYYRSVLERTNGASSDNGLIEHRYSYFNGGSLNPYHRMGNYILNAPYEIVPDIMIGETDTKIYRNDNGTYNLVKSTERKYRVDSLTHYINYVVRKNYEYTCYASPPATAEFNPFDIEEVYINRYTVQLDTLIEKDYMDNDQVVTKTTIMDYDGPYTYPTRTRTTGSNGVEEKTEFKYPQDYTNVNYMLNRNIVSPVMEEKQYRNSTVVLTRTNSYGDWFSDEKVPAPDSAEIKLYANNAIQRIVFYAYDTLGNVIELAKEKDQRMSYIWDYKNNFPIAKVQNASNGVIAYTSFEAEGSGGWTLTGTFSSQAYSITGRRSFNGTAAKTVSSGNYIVTAWTKNDASLTVNSSGGTHLRTAGAWKLYQWTLNSTSSISVSGTNYDELRLYPQGAFMTTFTYEPLRGVTTQADINNQIVYYDYDVFGRLSLIRDIDRNVIKKICYNYYNQPDACTLFGNVLKSGNFTTSCGAGYTASTVTYTVYENTYYSTVSQEAADSMATSDLNRYGPAYANENGTCTPVCTNCTGVGYKCVNGNCQLGTKVYTNSVQIGPHLWECTYHYEWTDGSWSGNYTEESPTSCSIIIE